MKSLINLVILFLGISQYSIATPVIERQIAKGTILNYAIKEGAVTYKLKATIISWETEGNIKIQWQASGGKIMKGIYTMTYASVGYSSDIKIKLKPGTESLIDDNRLFIGYNIYDDLFNLGREIHLNIDGVLFTLIHNKNVIEKDVQYNNVKTKMNYAEGNNEEKTVTIGLTEYNSDVIILNNYSSGSFSIKLLSIQNPVSRSANTTPTAEDLAKEILEAMAPKTKTPLTKMEPAKFAIVKSKYPVLASIENYDPTNGGSIKKPAETYDYRYGSNSPNPPSLVDCLTDDIKTIYKQKTSFGMGDVTETIEDKNLPASVAKKVLGVYLIKDYSDIPGYRPWSNWKFVKSLTSDQRDQLANELEGYIRDYGFIEQ